MKEALAPDTLQSGAGSWARQSSYASACARLWFLPSLHAAMRTGWCTSSKNPQLLPLRMCAPRDQERRAEFDRPVHSSGMVASLPGFTHSRTGGRLWEAPRASQGSNHVPPKGGDQRGRRGPRRLRTPGVCRLGARK